MPHKWYPRDKRQRKGIFPLEVLFDSPGAAPAAAGRTGAAVSTCGGWGTTTQKRDRYPDHWCRMCPALPLLVAWWWRSISWRSAASCSALSRRSRLTSSG